jgi:mycothiol synthase
MYAHLATGYSVRSPTTDDIPAIIAVMHALDLAETGEADVYEASDILADWADLAPTTDVWVVCTPDGLLCGYATLATDGPSRLLADGYVHPDHTGHGIGTTLLALTEARAEAIVAALPGGTRQVLVNNIVASSDAARALLEGRGYALTRVYFRMHISLDAPPPPPEWPSGISVRACDGSPEDIRRAYETVEESFRDHWAHTPRSFEDWQARMVGERFDPSLWFLAQSGDQIAGAALCRVREPGKGWIGQVAVLRPWRQRGIGRALLQKVFGAFYQRGVVRVGLGVDGQSLTGAQRLYERAGMQVTMRMGRYEKELRAGADLAVDA